MMGMGEPLANYDNVVAAMQIMLDDHGGYGPPPAWRRRWTGCAKIAGGAGGQHVRQRRCATRSLPINKKYPLPRELLAACERQRAPRDFVTFEYVM